MSDEMRTGRDDERAIDERCGTTNAPRTLTLDVDRYQKYLDDADLSEAQKQDVLEALWSIIVSFVDLGFGVHPVQRACGQLPEIASQSSNQVVDVVNCKEPINKEFKGVVAQQCCSTTQE